MKKKPDMNEKQIKDRIKLLEQERESVKVTLLAYEGAIQDCNYWLEQLSTESKQLNKPAEKND